MDVASNISGVTSKIAGGKYSKKLCLLMFTRDNFEDAVNKAVRYSDSFDLVVIVDNSSRPPSLPMDVA